MLYITVNAQHKNNDSIECFELSTNLKGYYHRDTVDQLDTKYIYSMGEYTMYCVPVYSTNVSVELVGEELITRDTLKKWIEYNYYIYKNNRTIGREYSSEFKNASRPFNVDSLLTKKKVIFFTNIDKYKCVADSILPNYDLLRTLTLKDSNDSKLTDVVYADTVFFVYKKYSRNLQFDFMKIIDTIKDYHVVKVTYIYDSEWQQFIRDKKSGPFFRELFYELMQVPVKEYDKVYALFQKFIKDIAR